MMSLDQEKKPNIRAENSLIQPHLVIPTPKNIIPVESSPK